MSRLLVVAALVVASGLPARADDLPKQLAPDLVRTEHDMCDTSTGYGRDFVHTGDVDGDGRRDVVLDYAQVLCGGRPDPYCTADGCLLKVWLGGAGGYRKAFEGRVRSWRVETVGGRRALMLDGRPLAH